MKLKKLIAILLTVCIILLMCGCSNRNGGNGNGQQTPVKPETSANLLYCSNDTFNPYSLITKVNFELCQLLFEPLIKLDNNFEPIYALAKSSTVNEKVYTIKLKDAKFSDSSKVTAEDIIYSFNLAKNHERYSSSLANVINIAGSLDTVEFTLKYFDPYFINLLEFPIIKKESDTVKNQDSVILPPIGSGRYILNSDHTKLEINKNYYGERASFDKINLINAPDNESISHYVEFGATDFYYANTNDGTIFRMDGKKISVNQNRLIYLGMNMNLLVFKEPKIRYCISAAIDREKIVSNAYYSNALAAKGPLTPAFKSSENYQTIETSANTKIAIENLEEIGYNKLDSLGYRTTQNGKGLEFTLLVNSENASQKAAGEIIISSLKDIGIKVTLRALPYNDYIRALNSGAFQLYLAEVKINNNFDLSELILPGGSCAYGIPKSAQTSQADTSQEDVNDTTQATQVYGNDLKDLVYRYRSGTVSLSDVVTAVGSQMPFIPLCYRSGVLFYSYKIGEITEVCSGDLFLSLKSK